MGKKAVPNAGKSLEVASCIRAAEYVRMSTEHQRYSIENQSEAIRQYAALNGMAVVRTYMDYGKSGLHVHGRAGLQALLFDVDLGQADYSVILVYDVSRWGRFQDSDEAAYYEHLCKRAGVRVMYCSEPFENNNAPMSGIIKSIRRAMAAEYSRTLSVRVWNGHRHMVELGFKPGGRAGYGLRRQLVDEHGKPKCLLRLGDRKGLATDRVTFVPGPPEEIAVVKAIFARYLEGSTLRQISDRLNGRTPRPKDGYVWSKETVRLALANEKYTGTLIYNRQSTKLSTKPVQNPREQWIRNEGAFEALVSRETFVQVQQERARRSTSYSNATLLQGLRHLLQTKGALDAKIIDADPGTPGSTTFTKRFGTLANAYAAVGYCRINVGQKTKMQRHLKQVRAALIDKIAEGFARVGSTVSRNLATDVMLINGRRTVSVSIMRSCSHKRGPRSQMGMPECRLADYMVFARMNVDNEEINDYFVIPISDRAVIPKSVTCLASPIQKYRLATLDALYDRL